MQTTRFDLLEVWDPVLEVYINVADVLEQLETQIQNLQILDTGRLDAVEAKLASLDAQKATKFVALDPLSLDEGTFPNQLSQSSPTPASASAINLNGETAYIQFDGRTHVLEFTKDWSIGCSIQTQGDGTQATNMTFFHLGACH